MLLYDSQITYIAFFALSLAALWGIIQICCFATRAEINFPFSKRRNITASQARKGNKHDIVASKSEQWYRNTYFQLHNLEDHTEVLKQAREELLAMFSRAISLESEKSQGGILSIRHYDSNAVWEFVHDELRMVMSKWQAYLDRRKRGYGPELFDTIEAAKKWLIQQAPMRFVDGAWLAHINKITTQFPLRSFTKDAWQVFSEELGDGDLSKHHIHLYAGNQVLFA